MQLHLNDQIDSDVWNRLAGMHVFHRYEWRKVIEAAYGMKPFFVLATHDNFFALYPSFLKGDRCVSMPFTNVAGYLSNSDALRQSLSNWIRERGYRDCYRTLLPLEATASRITGIVDVSDPGSYVASLSHNMRNQLKKSQTGDLEFKRRRDLDLFYSLYCRKMHELGTPPHKRIFFQLILDNFSEAEIFATMHKGSVVSAMFCVVGLDAPCHERSTLHILWAASDPHWDHLYVNYFTYWKAMLAAAESGIHLVDLGTTRFESPHHAFKRKWKPVFYAIQEHGVQTQDLADRKSAQVLSAVWRRTPVWFADTVGPQLRKYLI